MVPKVLIYHTAVSDKSTLDDKDVLDEAAFVSEVLINTGYDVETREYNALKVKQTLEEIKPSFIFNLVEAINGKDSSAYIAPMSFERQGIPYTGCTFNSFLKTQTKLGAKEIMKLKEIPTPYWLTIKDLGRMDIPRKKFLIKSDINHASKGLEANLLDGIDKLRDILRYKGEDFFAEEYIEGREFNVSLIGPVGDGKILPIPEIKFVDWPNGKPKIVDYNAKWNEGSLEYNNTSRSFDLSERDSKLFESLEDISKKCWDIFNLRGYARVDFRVDENNQPYVLEINANPCISPDAGFVAACKKAGMTEEEIIRGIIKDSCGEEFVI
ncbi:MAG: D-alanine--D-alanine ligase family protein [Nanobdellota archaeon]